MAVVLARQVADCLCPTGGTEHRVTETLSGIHLHKETLSTGMVNDKKWQLLDEKMRVLLL
jgi:hypothetical protein